MDQQEPQPILEEIQNKIDISKLPQHQPFKFIEAQKNNQIEIVIEDGHEVGFKIKDQDTIYEMDYEDGFFEPNGCYYGRDFEPRGWWVLDKDNQEYFYDIEGRLDGEDNDNEIIQ